jgi:hypothetical protein
MSRGIVLDLEVPSIVLRLLRESDIDYPSLDLQMPN